MAITNIGPVDFNALAGRILEDSQQFQYANANSGSNWTKPPNLSNDIYSRNNIFSTDRSSDSLYLSKSNLEHTIIKDGQYKAIIRNAVTEHFENQEPSLYQQLQNFVDYLRQPKKLMPSIYGLK